MPGPLEGVRIIEMEGIGPGPFAAMMLADHGAQVIRVRRPGAKPVTMGLDLLGRSRQVLAVDLKSPEGVTLLRDLSRSAHGIIEGFRPGVMERLGLGPDVLLQGNPALVYGRMTGWGQDGPLAKTAGHDINFTALAGALAICGRADQPPAPPANLLGDFGGGGMLLAFAMLAALHHATRTGEGQVVDCAMIDGAALLTTGIWGLQAGGLWRDRRGTNLLDSGAPFYDVYETADGGWIAIGAIEPQFYAALREKLGVADDPAFDHPFDAGRWPDLKNKMAEIFRSRTRDAWCAVFDGTDCCAAPVLSLAEAPLHPHNRQRRNFHVSDGVTQPAPAPRYSGTPLPQPWSQQDDRKTRDALLEALGYDKERIDGLQLQAVIG
jgi:alpha-methylacyl-CoA racemase